MSTSDPNIKGSRMTDRITKGVQSASDPFEFILSSESKDRVGDVIKQDGWKLTAFKQNPIALFGHSHGFPIGTWKSIRVEGTRLIAKLDMAAPGTSPRIDEIRSLIEQGILKAVSVGFRILDYEPMDEKEPWGAWLIKKAELLETSVVSVPANPDALALAKSLGVSKDTRELVFGSRDGVSASGRKSLSTPTRKKGVTPMKLGDRIVSVVASIDGLKDQISDVVKTAEDAGRELLEEETLQIEELSEQLTSAEQSLKGLQAAEKALASRAEKVEATRSASATPAKVKTGKDSDLIFKAAHVSLRAYVEKKSPLTILDERYSNDERVGAMVKAATEGANTTTVGWAAELVDTALVGFMQELKPVSVYGRLADAGTAIPFGMANAVTVPRRAGAGQVPGSFVGENATIPVKQGEFASTTYNRYKAAVITMFSKELQRVSNPQIEGLLRDAIMTDTGIMLDSVLLDPAATAIAGIRPASPWNGSATQASAGDTLADILTDLRFLLDTLSAANAGRMPYIVMNPSRLTGLSMLTNANGSFVFRDEIAQGRIMGVPLIVSTNCPAQQVYIVDAADFGTAFGSPEFDVSEQATLVMADDDGVAPTMADTNAVSVAGSLNVSDAAGTTPPTVVRSMFQTWELALRMVMPVSWGMMRTGVVAHITAVTW